MDIQLTRRYPQNLYFVTGIVFQTATILVTFVLVIYYNASFFLHMPYTGVWLGSITEQDQPIFIETVDLGSPGDRAGLKAGDQVVTIDGRTIVAFNRPYHLQKSTGDAEVYLVKRNGQSLEIPVEVGSYRETPGALLPMLPGQILSLSIYFLGVALLFLAPPSDVRARLVAVMWLLAGVALSAALTGYTSSAWFAPEVIITTYLVSAFFSIAAHIYFPVPSFSDKARNRFLWGLIVVIGVMVACYLLDRVIYPATLPEFTPSAVIAKYIFLASWVINIGLLLKNSFFVKHKEVRRQTRIVFMGTLIGFLPYLLLTAVPGLLFGWEHPILPSSLTTLSLLFIPISYGYVINQRKLLKIDFIINRGLVLFLYILVVLFTSATVLGLISILLKLPPQIALIGGLLCVVITIAAATLQKRIQVQVDKVLYGGYYDFTTVTSDLSSDLAQVLDRDRFVNILTVKLADMMKVEQSAVLLLRDNCLDLQGRESRPFSVAIDDAVIVLLANSRVPVRAQNLWNLVDLEAVDRWKELEWAQIFAPISHGDNLYGVLVLGNRSANDVYSDQDLLILNTVSQQASLSVSNIFLVESLRGLNRKLVRADEEQRRKIARDLHDDVLQNLFFVKTRLSTENPELVRYIDETIARLRQTIKAQRPPALDRGLVLALTDLVNDINQMTAKTTVICLENGLETDLVLDDECSVSIYRVVQEALSNVIKHADADNAVVSLKKEGDLLKVTVRDNGIGIANQGKLQAGHYGIIGMSERTTMINANLEITSEMDTGTTITLCLNH